MIAVFDSHYLRDSKRHMVDILQNINDVVIVNFNSSKCTIDCINSIKAITWPKCPNIIVIDNNSNDSPKTIVDECPGIKFFQNRKNNGFAKSVNSAFKQCSSEFVLILNPDTLLKKGFFDSICDYIAHEKDVAVIGPSIYEANGALQGSARKFPTALTSIFGRKSQITKWFPNNSITKSEFACFTGNGEPIEVDWVSGACMIIRREAFESVGGFDEKLFLYWEDADLCRRLKKKSWRIVYYPQAKIQHFVGQSSNSRPIASIIHFHYSCYKYFIKHAHGFWRVNSPFVLSGLVLRCALAMLLDSIKRNNKLRS